MAIYAINRQFNNRFWVDMRYGVAYINELPASVKDDTTTRKRTT